MAASIAIMFAGSTLLTPLYELFRQELGFSQLTLTLIYAVYVVGNLLALLLFGHLSDQVGCRRVVLSTIVLAGISAFLYLRADSIAWLYCARMLSGLAIGVASGTATAWIAELYSGRNKGRDSQCRLAFARSSWRRRSPGSARSRWSASTLRSVRACCCRRCTCRITHSLSLLLIGTALGGVSAALGYRGSLQVVNQIAPGNQRAEVLSAYLLACYCGNSLPVIGVGVPRSESSWAGTHAGNT